MPAAIGILFLTGFYLLFGLGGFGVVGNYVWVMLGLAVIMTAVFKFIYVAPFRHLKENISESGNQKVAVYALGTIRKLVATNLTLGIIVVVVAIAGKGLLG